MLNFINNYRLSVAEAIEGNEYVDAIARTIAFPVFYLAAVLTNLVFESRLLSNLTGAISKVANNK